MADPTGNDLNHPLLNLTAEEKRVFSQLFQQADTERLGVVTGEIAVKFFEKTKVSPPVLGEIWQIADTENRGLLTRPGFCVALRLIGHYQAGREPTPELAFKSGPLPKFEGMTFAPASPALGTPPAALQAQGTGGPIRVPPLTPDKIAQYSGLFERSGAHNGTLPGDTAKAIFERAGLPNEVLGRIWSLSDREQKGALGTTEFIIAMHLITSYKSRTMTALPNVLPPGLYEAAARRGAPPPGRQGSIPTPAATAIPRQFTGPQRAQSPLNRPPYPAPPPQSAQTTGTNWLVTPPEKAKYDQFFTSIDTAGSGYLTGDQAVKFFSDSGLPEETLASVWDLADIRSEGQLNKDEFAVAMYLIRQQRSGSAPLPAFLPAALIPPSMRGQPQPTPLPTAPAFNNAANSSQLPKSASEDLFGLDASPPPPAAPIPAPVAAPVQTQQMTGSTISARRPFDNDPFAGSMPSSPASPQRANFQTPQQTGSNVFKPFMPTSAFGASLTTQPTGGSVTSSQGQAQQPPQIQARGLPQVQAQAPSAMDDLLGDNDAEESRKLTDETTELANMSTQVGNLRNQMQETQTKRSTHERDLSATSNQKRDLELRLSQFRTQYEQEVLAVKTLEVQLAASRTETTRLQQEFAMLEGTHRDLYTQHQQVAQALEADQRENVTLKQRIAELNAEVAQIRPQIEKLKSDARQQKGMVAINRKQLATNEGERDRLNSEVTDLARAVEEDRAKAAESERLKVAEAERYRAAEAERVRVAEEDRAKTAEAERLAIAEHEKARSAEAERQRVLAEDAAKAAEAERTRAAEAERTRVAEAERTRLAEAERTKAAETERKRIAEEERTTAAQAEHSRSMFSTTESEAPVVSPPARSASTNPFFRQGSQSREVGVASPGVASPGAFMATAPSSSAFDALFGPSFASMQHPGSTAPPQTSFARLEEPAAEQSVSSEGRPTPSATPPLSLHNDSPHINEPPPPPEAGQFTARALPLREPLSRDDSVASSTRVQPPASRAGYTPSEAPSFEPASRDVSSPFAASTEHSAFVSSTAAWSAEPATLAAPSTEPERPDSAASLAHEAVPGAFPDEPSLPVKSTSNESEQPAQPLGLTANRAAPDDDFESAFAGFGQDAATESHAQSSSARELSEPTQAARGISNEFPPIQNLEHDESDSDSEQGFGDDFGSERNTAPNGAPAISSEAVASNHVESALPASGLSARPLAYAANSALSELPDISAQRSPPTYDETTSPGVEAGGFARATSNNLPPEFEGLLPAREDPTSPESHLVPEQTAQPPIASPPSTFHPPQTPAPAFGDDFHDVTSQPVTSVMEAATTTGAPHTTTTTAKSAFDDDDFADFDGLDEAKAADERGFDFADHHSEAEFNPTFDSPAASVSNTMASAQQTPVARFTQPSNGFNSFGSGYGHQAQPSISTAFGQTSSPQATKHDWDAIFSGLDSPATNIEPSFGGTSSTVTGAPFNARNFGESPTPKMALPAPAPVPPPREKPQLGRALTQGTEHDDPILKRLTGMGYPRQTALDALERFDYDINRAVDHLSSS